LVDGNILEKNYCFMKHIFPIILWEVTLYNHYIKPHTGKLGIRPTLKFNANHWGSCNCISS